MNDDDLREVGPAVLDWVASYRESVIDRASAHRSAPGDVRRLLPGEPPENPEEWATILDDLDRIVTPHLLHWQSGNFFGYFPANSTTPSILGDLVSAGLGIQGMLWTTSPAATEVETHVLDWMVSACDLPPEFSSRSTGGGVISDSASSSTLTALLAARERARAGGARLSDQVVCTSADAHSSVEKGARVAGFEPDHVRSLAVDSQRRLSVDALRTAIDDDLGAGRCPTAVVATVGTTSVGSVDPVDAIADVVIAHGIWLHVDAAYSGAAGVHPDHRTINAGLDRADSYCFDPHKWLLTNFDCSLMWLRNRRELTDALSISAPYLQNSASDSDEVIDYRDWAVPLGRRFRALKLWFVIRRFGLSGLRDHIERHVNLAANLAHRVDSHPHLRLFLPPHLGLVTFVHRDGAEATRAVMAAIAADGVFTLTQTECDGEPVGRVAVGAVGTQQRHVDALWERLDVAAQKAASPPR